MFGNLEDPIIFDPMKDGGMKPCYALPSEYGVKADIAYSNKGDWAPLTRATVASFISHVKDYASKSSFPGPRRYVEEPVPHESFEMAAYLANRIDEDIEAVLDNMRLGIYYYSYGPCYSVQWACSIPARRSLERQLEGLR